MMGRRAKRTKCLGSVFAGIKRVKQPSGLVENNCVGLMENKYRLFNSNGLNCHVILHTVFLSNILHTSSKLTHLFHKRAGQLTFLSIIF